MNGIKLCATGSYLPGHIVDNEAYTAFVETSDEWIRTRTGIVTRHVADSDATWMMGAKAARSAIEKAGVDPEEIGLIIGTTVSADYVTPSMACIIQQAVGAKNAFCFDLNAACAGFVFALDMARRYLYSGGVDTCLLYTSVRRFHHGFRDHRGRFGCCRRCPPRPDGDAPVLRIQHGRLLAALARNGQEAR